MGKSIKLGSDTFLDSSGVTVDSSGTTLASWITDAVSHGCGAVASGTTTDYRHYSFNFSASINRVPVIVVINHQSLGNNATIVQGYISIDGSGAFKDSRVTASGGVISIDAGASAYAPQMVIYPMMYANVWA